MKKQVTRTLAVLSACVLTAVSAVKSDTAYSQQRASAKTVSEIEAEKKSKQAQIDAKKAVLAELAEDINNTAAYEQTLQEEADLIGGKMLLIDTQLRNVQAEIAAKQAEITDTEQQIAAQELAVQEGLDVFKARIRTLYMHGNDSLLSALIEARDFSDALMKIDLIRRVSAHDNEVIKSLRTDIQSLHTAEQSLNAELQTLNIQQTEMDVLLQEFSSSRDELNAAVLQIELSKQFLITAQTTAAGELEVQQTELGILEEEEEVLILEAARKAAEEEEERRAAASDAAQNAASGTTSTPQPSAVTNPVYQGGVLAWPAPGYYHISSPFGARWGSRHTGIDITGGGVASINGANICAASAGRVILVKTGCTHNYAKTTTCGCNYGYGNYVEVSHGNGLVTLYAHLATVDVTVGEQLTAGQKIGNAGSTGNSTGPHLHFSVIENGVFSDPQEYLY